MAVTVYFARLDDGAGAETQAEAVGRVVEAAGFLSRLSKRDMVAVKLHVGEKSNTTHVRPEVVARVVALIGQQGALPFLTDTSTLYRGQRENGILHALLAHRHGFGIEAVGAPFLPLDGLCGQHEVEVAIEGELNKTVKIAGDVLLADALVAISHPTGHIATGLGAAIKNVGMGLASRAGKMRQHSTVAPEVDAAKCERCGKCIRWCPQGAIESVGATATGPARAGSKASAAVARIIADKCIGCGQCLAVCRYGAVRFNYRAESPALQRDMAEHAAAALKHFGEKALYLNVLVDMTSECDCMNVRQKKAIPDRGILASRDIVAVDRATLDLTAQKDGKDLSSRFYPEYDASIQIEHARKLGLGSTHYRVVDV